MDSCGRLVTWKTHPRAEAGNFQSDPPEREEGLEAEVMTAEASVRTPKVHGFRELPKR